MIPELEKHLEQLGRRQIVVGGVEAHMCLSDCKGYGRSRL